ncbi:hypothetical protein ADUPG1_006650, partial [Aduncisulcus paluster]
MVSNAFKIQLKNYASIQCSDHFRSGVVIILSLVAFLCASSFMSTSIYFEKHDIKFSASKSQNNFAKFCDGKDECYHLVYCPDDVNTQSIADSIKNHILKHTSEPSIKAFSCSDLNNWLLDTSNSSKAAAGFQVTPNADSTYSVSIMAPYLGSDTWRSTKPEYAEDIQQQVTQGVISLASPGLEVVSSFGEVPSLGINSDAFIPVAVSEMSVIFGAIFCAIGLVSDRSNGMK